MARELPVFLKPHLGVRQLVPLNLFREEIKFRAFPIPTDPFNTVRFNIQHGNLVENTEAGDLRARRAGGSCCCCCFGRCRCNVRASRCGRSRSSTATRVARSRTASPPAAALSRRRLEPVNFIYSNLQKNVPFSAIIAQRRWQGADTISITVGKFFKLTYFSLRRPNQIFSICRHRKQTDEIRLISFTCDW